MEDSEYDNIARLEAQHWWYRGMATISHTLLAGPMASTLTKEAVPASPTSTLRILDAGCGPGGMLTQLAAYGSPTGLDFHPLAIARAQQRYAQSYPLLRANISQIPIANNQFDLITSFDVLYHRAVLDDAEALSEFWRVLKPRGWLLIRVPALDSLRGAHDNLVHTQRRYTRTRLSRLLQSVGFNLQKITYANSLLFPLIYLRRRLQVSLTTNRAGSKQVTSDVELPAPIANRLLETVLKIESLWLRRANLPLGVSLFALAAKPL